MLFGSPIGAIFVSYVVAQSTLGVDVLKAILSLLRYDVFLNSYSIVGFKSPLPIDRLVLHVSPIWILWYPVVLYMYSKAYVGAVAPVPTTGLNIIPWAEPPVL